MSCFCFKPRHGAHSPEENGARDRADTAVEMRPSGTSMSSAVTVCQGSFPDLPIAYDTLKLLLREGLMPEARLFWWPLLPRVMVGTTMRTDPKIKSIATALYLKSKVLLSPDQQPSLSSYDTISTPSVTGTVRADLNTSADTTTNAKPIKNTSTSSPPRTHAETLKALYSARVRELLELLTVLYDIPEPGLITPLLGILVLMIPSIDICLQVCFDLLCRQDWFLPLSTAEHRLNVFSFKELLKKHLPDEYRALDESGALQAANLDLIFVNFFQSLLPFQSVVRVLDCYLLEGTKVLCNFGLGLIFLNRDLTHLTLSPKAPLSSDGSSSSGGKESRIHPFWKAVKRRCFNGDLGFSELVGASFSSTSFSRRSDVRSEVKVYKRLGKETMAGESLREPLNLGYRQSSNRVTASPSFSSFSSSSAILNSCAKSQFTHLRALLPKTSRDLGGMRCVFSTHQDGWSLDTLYRKTLQVVPCVLLLRSLQQNIILGAYFSEPISPPSQEVRGDGRTFVFRLDGEDSAAYRWSGTTSSTTDTDTDCTSNNTGSNKTRSELEKESTVNQFVVAGHDYLAVGAGQALGSNALRIDADLASCYAGPSDTFANPPLAPEELMQPFMIGELEVLQMCDRGSSVADVAVPRIDLFQKQFITTEEHN